MKRGVFCLYFGLEARYRASILRAAVILSLLIGGGGLFAQSVADDETNEIQMPEVLVSDARDGGAENGYRVETAKQVGPWGELSLQDTPYSITVLSEDFIQNTINHNTDHLWDLTPNVYFGFGGDWARGGNGTTMPNARGLGMTGLVNGVRVGGMGGFFLEEMERVEVNTGLTGFLYGGGYVGGSVNFETKRPTQRRRTSFTLANTGGSNYTTHVDTSGPLIAGKLGYRLNLLYGDGETAVQNVYPGKRLISGAIDWHATDNLLIRFDAAYRGYQRRGHTADFPNQPNSAAGPILVDPINPSYSYIPDWVYSEWGTNKFGTDLEWKINDVFSLRGAYHWESTDNKYLYMNPANFDAEGNFTQSLSGWRNKNRHNGTYLYADAVFDTYGFKHQVTGGTSFNEQNNRIPYPRSRGQANMGTYNLFDGSWKLVPSPDWPNLADFGTDFFMRTRNRQLNFAIGDEINYNDRYILMLGYVYTHIYAKSFDWVNGSFSGRPGDMYNEGKNSFTASFVYKPMKDLSLFATAIQATEQGTYVPFEADQLYDNEGEYLLPTTSTQYEFGAKQNLGGILLCASYFYIERANLYDEYHDNGTRSRTQDGRQRHHGIEFSATGNLRDSLTVVGGFTVNNAKTTKTNNAAMEGVNLTNVPFFQIKTWLEYQTPFLRSFYVTGGIRYMGSQYYPDYHRFEANLPTKLRAYTVGEIGARYGRMISGVDTTFRVNVQNVSDAWYWRRANWGNPGDPRAVTFSVTTAF